MTFTIQVHVSYVKIFFYTSLNDRLAMRTQKELVLLHKEGSNTKPSNTIQWLNMRPWVTSHHHIICSQRMFSRKSHYRIVILFFINKENYVIKFLP